MSVADDVIETDVELVFGHKGRRQVFHVTKDVHKEDVLVRDGGDPK